MASKQTNSSRLARMPRSGRTKKTWLVEVLGWYGFVAILGAYGLISFDVISQNSLFYQLLNLSGALGLFAVAFSKKATQPAILNIIWAVVAIVAIISLVIKGEL